MVNIGVIGHTGRLGKPLVELLTRHPEANIVYTESRKEGESGNINNADFIFLALPKGESEPYLAKCEGKRIIDLSEDHRDSSGWVYGLAELEREEIRSAQKVANPGCYATSIILGLLPVKGCVQKVSIASTSGISGAGMAVSSEDQFLIYKDGNTHSHLKEIQAALKYNELSPGEILFVPQRIDTADRGIISTIFASYDGLRPAKEAYKSFYEGNPFVKLVDTIETKAVNRTNNVHIKVQQFSDNRLIVLSTLDNIVKGGSGHAIQNFNIMNGFDETLGLLN
ncbi:MAG: hypothetical protein WCK29_01140 [archaeon]